MEGKKELYILDKNCTKLDLSVNYRSFSNKGFGKAPTGFFVLRKAFMNLWSYSGGEIGLTLDVREAIGVFFVFTC